MRAALALLLCLSSAAYGQNSPAVIQADINSHFPDNTTGAITPLDVRTVLGELLATTRWRLPAQTTFYVRADGNDTNIPCATNTAAGACATVQGAINVVQNYVDLNGAGIGTGVPAVVIQLFCAATPCTYAGNVQIGPWTGAGHVLLRGDPTSNATAGNYGLSGTYLIGQVGGVAGSRGTELFVSGVKFTAANAVSVQDSSRFRIDGPIEFAGGGNQITITRHSMLNIASAYLISAGGISHINMTQNSVSNTGAGSGLVTITGTPTFTSAFLSVVLASTVGWPTGAITYSGAINAATPVTFICTYNAAINTGVTPNTYLPAGALAPGLNNDKGCQVTP